MLPGDLDAFTRTTDLQDIGTILFLADMSPYLERGLKFWLGNRLANMMGYPSLKAMRAAVHEEIRAEAAEAIEN